MDFSIRAKTYFVNRSRYFRRFSWIKNKEKLKIAFSKLNFQSTIKYKFITIKYQIHYLNS